MKSKQPEDAVYRDANNHAKPISTSDGSTKIVSVLPAKGSVSKYYPLDLAQLALDSQESEWGVEISAIPAQWDIAIPDFEKIPLTQLSKVNKAVNKAVNTTRNTAHSHYQTDSVRLEKQARLKLIALPFRHRMIKRLEEQGIADARVLKAMAAIPRHLFVDPALAEQAYEEIALSIGYKQTISRPFVIARMLERLMAHRWLKKKPLKMLEIGTGCGYQAAVLSELAQEVYSIERIGPLFERAKHNLRPLRIPNVRLHHGDGRLGFAQAAPFDAIIVAAAGLEIPPALLEQLKIGGRCIAPIGHKMQSLVLTERTSATQWRESILDTVFFVPLKSGVI